jgi:hypothetical protein
MAHTAYSHDEKPAKVDAPLEEIGNAASALEKPIRVRLAPDLYNWTTREYRAWYGLAWSCDLQDVAEGKRLREGLENFFTCFGGTERQQNGLLAELEKRADAVRG